MARIGDGIGTTHGVRAADAGLAIERRFTRPDVHPFDEIEWETRHALIGDPAKPAFEQRDVEFPKSWSQNATNIVAQKYFRGQMGSPQREHSVKQMVGRVAGTIAEWGREGRYFATADDADAFEAELTHILVNQLAAFNSPVWFNVGFEETAAVLGLPALSRTRCRLRGHGSDRGDGREEQIGREVYDAHGVHARSRRQGEWPQAGVARTASQRNFVEATADHVVKALRERRTEPQWLRVDQLEPGMRMHLHPHRAVVSAGPSWLLARWGRMRSRRD